MRIACLVGFVGFVVLAACGGDDSNQSGGAGGSGAKAGNASKAGMGGASGAAKTLACGAKTCRVPADSPYELCCKDEFASACGTRVANECRQMRAEIDTDCPLPDIAGIADATAGSSAGGGVSGCCTADNECGLDLGIGTGCSSNASYCTFFPPPYNSRLALITCDGKAIDDVPEACKPTEGAAGE